MRVGFVVDEVAASVFNFSLPVGPVYTDLHTRFGMGHGTWDRRLYFPSEGRRAEDFVALKNPTASTGFEPANLGTKGQHATYRPPKPLPQSYSRSDQ